MFIAWGNMGQHETKSKCNGCKYEYTRHEIICPSCTRDKHDNYTPERRVD